MVDERRFCREGGKRHHLGPLIRAKGSAVDLRADRRSYAVQPGRGRRRRRRIRRWRAWRLRRLRPWTFEQSVLEQVIEGIVRIADDLLLNDLWERGQRRGFVASLVGRIGHPLTLSGSRSRRRSLSDSGNRSPNLAKAEGACLGDAGTQGQGRTRRIGGERPKQDPGPLKASIGPHARFTPHPSVATRPIRDVGDSVPTNKHPNLAPVPFGQREGTRGAQSLGQNGLQEVVDSAARSHALVQWHHQRVVEFGAEEHTNVPPDIPTHWPGR